VGVAGASRRWRGARRKTPAVRHPTLGLIVVFVLGLPFGGGFLSTGESALASLWDAGPSAHPLEIVRPSASFPVGDGNLTFIEASAIDRTDGTVDRVEFAIDGSDQWHPAHRVESDHDRWRYLWSDPTVGSHRIRARAYGVEATPVVEDSSMVTVADTWSAPYIIDNPYAVPGSFRKGQLHMHSSASFDAWYSLPPAHFALEYKALGYQFVVLTDHDVISYPREVNDASFISIPGYESTAETGHVSALFADRTVSPLLAPQERINAITAAGGLAVLNHPGWRVGWTGTDLSSLHGYAAMEVFNGATSDPQRGARANLVSWQGALNTKGRASRVWAVAVDDAHRPEEMNRGWVMVKAAQLTPETIKHALESGNFYASNGPSFVTIGVLEGAITASSPDAAVARFFDHEGNLLAEAPAAWGSYRPTGKERWVRVEAVMADGRSAWSQPFWLIPNAPRVSLTAGPRGISLIGQTMPGARIHLSDRGEYLGSVVANDDGAFSYQGASLATGNHDLWLIATAPWPDQLEGPPTLLTWGASEERSVVETLGRWVLGNTIGMTRTNAQRVAGDI